MAANCTEGLLQRRGPLRSSQSEAGETLIEILVTVMILGIVAAALLGAILASLRTSNATRTSADADVLLRSFAAQVASQLQGTAWGTGCPQPIVPDAMLPLASSLRFQPPKISSSTCTVAGLEEVVLSVTPKTNTSATELHIWVRQP